MGQPTLFDDGTPEPAPEPKRLPVEPWQVDELVLLGVTREKAESFTLKQAFAVLAKLRKGKGLKPVVRPLPAPLDDTTPVLARGAGVGGFREVERVDCANELERELARHAEGGTTDDELMRFTRGCLWYLTAVELVRVGKGLVILLRARATDDRSRTGRADAADAGRAANVLPDADAGGPGDE